MSSAQVFSDVFDIKQKDPKGRKFDKVSRFICKSRDLEMELALDINIDIYPLEVGESFRLTLANTLYLDGTSDSGVFDPKIYEKKTLMDEYEYVMHGKVFKFQLEKSGSSQVVSILISFGGLLMMIKGDAANVEYIEPDARLYLLMRKISKAEEDR